MAKLQTEQYKKKIILSGLFFIALWVLSNNSEFSVNYGKDLFPFFPQINFEPSNDLLNFSWIKFIDFFSL